MLAAHPLCLFSCRLARALSNANEMDGIDSNCVGGLEASHLSTFGTMELMMEK